MLNRTLGQFLLGGPVSEDLTLRRTPVPYQVISDVTVMPGVTLTIERGVEMEFWPDVGVLVLGHLQAAGSVDERIEMRPVRQQRQDKQQGM